MKNATAYLKPLQTLLKRLDQQYPDVVADVPCADPVEELVKAFLCWNAKQKDAEKVLKRIDQTMVDLNELRVSLVPEMVDVMGSRYPQAVERAGRLRDALGEVFIREHGLTLSPLADKSKRDVRTYLETLPGIMPYAWARVLLVSFQGHAIPVDDAIAQCLRQEGAVEASATVDQISAFLERHIRAEDGPVAAARLKAWAEDNAGPIKTTAPASLKKTTRRSSRSAGSSGTKPALPRSTKAGDEADGDPKSADKTTKTPSKTSRTRKADKTTKSSASGSKPSADKAAASKKSKSPSKKSTSKKSRKAE